MIYSKKAAMLYVINFRRYHRIQAAQNLLPVKKVLIIDPF